MKSWSLKNGPESSRQAHSCFAGLDLGLGVRLQVKQPGYAIFRLWVSSQQRRVGHASPWEHDALPQTALSALHCFQRRSKADRIA